MNQEPNINEALIKAAEKGNLSEVQRLVENGADLNYLDSTYKIPPLFWAYIGNHEGVVRYLLAQGADTNYDGFDEGTLLIMASGFGYERFGHNKYVSLFINAGANVNLPMPSGAQTPAGHTALHQAADSNNPEAVHLLIQAGADVNQPNQSGETPLHIAAAQSNQEIVEVMIAAGANKTITTARGETPLDYAVRHQRPEEILHLLR
ncbi:ankyrin repeat domain-containing protein [Candidatus Poribacteria bacterium]|nr:ankyrin repeat domain-containing protein [Candidatus Poribacteria bacterium]